MWGQAMGGAWLLPLLLLLLPGSMGLQCLSCGEDDGSCHKATNVTCPTESEVCTEALAAVTWSHGQLALGARGCARGQPGAIARALELLGLVVFERRRNCAGSESCNHLLPLGERAALPLPANSSARTPNGLSCYGCPEFGPCPPTTIVHCYDDFRGCFHGNVTLRMGNLTLWRELRGCVQDGDCSRESRGDQAVTLTGSCCHGNLCNGDLTNKTFFEPDLPRLELLPHGHAPTAAPGNGTTKMADGEVSGEGKEVEMATTRSGVATGDKRAAGGKMAAEGKMAATDNAPTGNKMAAGDKMAATDNAPTGDKMATNDKMAAADNAHPGSNMATGDKMAAADNAHPGSNMAAGDNASSGHVSPRRPMGRKDGIKGPVGRGQAVGAGPGWLLPFLLVPLLR